MPSIPIVVRGARTSRTPAGAFAALLLLTLLSALWAWHAGISFGSLDKLAFGFAGLICIGMIYDLTGRSVQLSDGAYYCGLWLGLTGTAAILSYLAASLGRPLHDAELVSMDAALGFAWQPWFRFVWSTPLLYWTLLVAYTSGIVQIVVAVVYFAWTRQTSCNQQLWWTALVAMVLTAIASGLYPALGTFHHFQENLEYAVHLPHLLALRDGSITHFNDLQGIVTMPSYHTTQALLLMYAFRGQRRAFPWVMLLNVLMLLSTPSMGGHYLVDMVGGSAVAAVSIALVRVGLRRSERLRRDGELALVTPRPSRSLAG